MGGGCGCQNPLLGTATCVCVLNVGEAEEPGGGSLTGSGAERRAWWGRVISLIKSGSCRGLNRPPPSPLSSPSPHLHLLLRSDLFRASTECSLSRRGIRGRTGGGGEGKVALFLPTGEMGRGGAGKRRCPSTPFGSTARPASSPRSWTNLRVTQRPGDTFQKRVRLGCVYPSCCFFF